MVSATFPNALQRGAQVEYVGESYECAFYSESFVIENADDNRLMLCQDDDGGRLKIPKYLLRLRPQDTPYASWVYLRE